MPHSEESPDPLVTETSLGEATRVTRLSPPKDSGGSPLATAASDEWQRLFESLPQIVWVTRSDGYHTHFNAQWLEFTGRTLEESLGFGWNAALHPDDRVEAARRWDEATASGEPYEVEYRLRRHDGSYHWMLSRAAPIRGTDSNIVGWVGTCTDIDDLKDAQERLGRQAHLLDLTHDAVIVQDLEQRILYWNAGATRIHGVDADVAVGKTFAALVGADTRQVDTAMDAVLVNGEWVGELGAKHRAGRPVILECRWNLIRDDTGFPYAVMALNTDVTERHHLEAQLIDALHHRATHDALTDLVNRDLMLSRLHDALNRTSFDARGVVLIAFGLDDFKIINDALGHAAGDEVLITIANRLRDAAGDIGVIARLGGDRFGVMLEDASDAQVSGLVARLFDAIVRPVLLESGETVEVELSVGIARALPHHSAETLYRDAEATLYEAKRRGRHQVAEFSEKIHIDVLDRLALPQQLRSALTNRRHQLFCLFQPEVELQTGELFGVEALVRWQHPQRGLLAPDKFIPLAESVGLTGMLFDHVLDRALTTCASWEPVLRRRHAVSVNLSARDLEDSTLATRIAAALERTETPAELLWIEVTESALADVLTFRMLDAIHELGVKLAIDDFGTGWSSLNRLGNLPFDMLKIDRSFVSQLEPDNKMHHMVDATIQMAHALGMLTVAEGIETREQREILADMGCHVGQGYYFSRPLLADDAARRISPDGIWQMPRTRDELGSL